MCPGFYLSVSLTSWHVSRFLSEFESNKLACDEDNAELLYKQGKEFEQLACGAMSTCYRWIYFVSYLPLSMLLYTVYIQCILLATYPCQYHCVQCIQCILLATYPCQCYCIQCIHYTVYLILYISLTILLYSMYTSEIVEYIVEYNPRITFFNKEPK